MADKKFQQIVEFTDADDPRKKQSFCEPLEYDQPVPIAAVGDTVYLLHDGAFLLKVERRLVSYHPDYIHAQLFCKEVNEDAI